MAWWLWRSHSNGGSSNGSGREDGDGGGMIAVVGMTGQ